MKTTYISALILAAAGSSTVAGVTNTILIDDFTDPQFLQLEADDFGEGIVDGFAQGNSILAGEREVSLFADGLESGDTLSWSTNEGISGSGTMSVNSPLGINSGAAGNGNAFFSFFYRSFADGSVDFPDIDDDTPRIDFSSMDRFVIDVLGITGDVEMGVFVGTDTVGGGAGLFNTTGVEINSQGQIEILFSDLSPLFGDPNFQDTLNVSFDFILNENESLTLGSIYAVPAPSTLALLSFTALTSTRRKRS